MGLWLPELLNISWCGPICIPVTDQLVRIGVGPPTIVAPNRPWEGLRYKLLAGLTTAGQQAGWQSFAELWESLGQEWPLAIFHQLTPTEEFQCPPGRFVLRVAEAASMFSKGAALPNLTSVAYDFLVPSHALRQAFCSGWPVFRILSFLIESNPLHRSHEPDSGEVITADMPMESAEHPIEAFQLMLTSCALVKSLDLCLAAHAEEMKMLHEAQSELFFGSGICPPNTMAAWMDHMEPAEVFPICVRNEKNAVDNQIRLRGRWGECPQFAALLDHAGTPNCRILDIGANIGSCSLMFANLGYRVAAFEPLPRNVELLTASAKLNQRITGVSIGWDIAGEDSRVGAIMVLPYALSNSSGRGYIIERRENAGDSLVFDEGVAPPCDNRTYLCHNQIVRMERLDHVFQVDGDRICLAKIDVQGAEYQVLQGADALLRWHRIKTLIFEWRPLTALEAGRNPMATLQYLNQLRYKIIVPPEWIGWHGEEMVVVEPRLFPQLLHFKGDIIAIAGPYF